MCVCVHVDVDVQACAHEHACARACACGVEFCRTHNRHVYLIIVQNSSKLASPGQKCNSDFAQYRSLLSYLQSVQNVPTESVEKSAAKTAWNLNEFI